jgi:prepilin-type processing-associated H-X9-DG protein
LVEVLAVIAIVAILAAMLLPALDRTEQQAKRTACMNHLKQLGMCWHMYAADNNGRLVENLPAPRNSNSWVTGNMQNPRDATNTALLRQGKLFPYASHTAIYRCPGDATQTRGAPQVRSYAMNSWMGSRHMEDYSRRSGFRTFVRDSETAAAGPAMLWVMIEEHPASIDDGWFLVTMDDSRPFADFPTTRHQRGYTLNFADGHAEVYKMRDTKKEAGSTGSHVTAQNADWIRLKQVTTTR